jgi:hypothetical protein
LKSVLENKIKNSKLINPGKIHTEDKIQIKIKDKSVFVKVR